MIQTRFRLTKSEKLRKKLYNKNQKLDDGFTLLEMIVACTIVAMTVTWAIPDFRRGIAQSQVDKYARNIESGLFSFRAKMGAYKESCKIDFSNIPSFKPWHYIDASKILEQPLFSSSNNLKRSPEDPLYLCNYSDEELQVLENDSLDITSKNQAIERVEKVAASVRLVGQVNSKESKNIKISASTKTYTFTPPGTSINSNSMTLLIQSKEANKPWAKKADGTSRLVTRCIEASGNGQIFSGTWIEAKCQAK